MIQLSRTRRIYHGVVMTKNQKTPVQLTERQRRIADLYDGGLRTQFEVAKKLGISRATVARELEHMRDMEDLLKVEPGIFPKVWHGRQLTPEAEDDSHPFFGEPTISRSTAYRRTAKEWGYAPDQVDKPLHELKIAQRAITRALKLIEANDRKATKAAWQERDKIRDLIARFYD